MTKNTVRKNFEKWFLKQLYCGLCKRNNKSQIYRIKKQAFTLTEIIVSMVVLGLIIGGAVRTFGVAIYIHQQNEQRITAAYLAQECLEIIRNNRDTNWLQNQEWDYNITDIGEPFNDNFTRTVDVTDLKTIQRANPEDISIIISDEVKKEFVCTVSWNEEQHSVSASQILSNWQQ